MPFHLIVRIIYGFLSKTYLVIHYRTLLITNCCTRESSECCQECSRVNIDQILSTDNYFICIV